MPNKFYYIYILTNVYNTVLYLGMTNNLARRYLEHFLKANIGFTSKYNLNKLLYFEEFSNAYNTISREK